MIKIKNNLELFLTKNRDNLDKTDFSFHFLLLAILFGGTIYSSPEIKMGGYYDIKILAINRAEASVKMHIRMFNPDGSKIYDSVGFGLQLLENGRWKGSLIGKEISFEDLLDENWCQKYANGFVKSVEKVEQSSDPPIAILTIYCTDAAWLSHLSEGEEWESAAYEVARQYDPCEPILYQKIEHSNPDFDESIGWMPVPSFLFEQGSYRLPNVVFLPKFTESSYFIKNTIRYEQDDHLELLNLHGKYVKDLKNNEAGIFVWNDVMKRYAIYSIGRNSRGGSYYSSSSRSIEEIGFFALKPNFKRRMHLVSYSDLFRSVDPVIKSVQKAEKSITLEVTGIYDIDKLELNKAKVLKLICNNFVENYGYDTAMDSEFPLSKLIAYFAQKEENSATGILPQIADGIVLNYSYEYPDEYVEDFDSMDTESLVDYFENERWPRFKFHIELSDEVFGQQLDRVTQKVTPISLCCFSDDIKHWEEPILWREYQELMEK